MIKLNKMDEMFVDVDIMELFHLLLEFKSLKSLMFHHTLIRELFEIYSFANQMN